MRSDRISYADMLQETKELDEMNRPKPFSIVFIKADRKRKKAGEVVSLENAVRIGQAHNTVKHNTMGVTVLNNSHHPYAVHTRLILEFNGKKVYY